MAKRLHGTYTIKQLMESKDPIYVKCTSPDQGSLIGQYYYSDKPGYSGVWRDFDFRGHKEFYCYTTRPGISCGGWNPYIYENSKWIEFYQVDFTDSQIEGKKITGYQLIKQYPGCSKPIGTYEPFTTGEYSKWPEFWKPVYESDIEIGGYKAEVGKDGFGDVYVSFGCQRFLHEDLVVIRRLLNKEVDASITIRGTKITRDMLDTLIKITKELKTCKQ